MNGTLRIKIQFWPRFQAVDGGNGYSAIRYQLAPRKRWQMLASEEGKIIGVPNDKVPELLAKIERETRP